MALQQTLANGKRYALEPSDGALCCECAAWPYANGEVNAELCVELRKGFPAKPEGGEWECPLGKVWKEIG